MLNGVTTRDPSHPHTLPVVDHNLIFGLLALQMDFVTRDQLLDAMHAWMLRKTTFQVMAIPSV